MKKTLFLLLFVLACTVQPASAGKPLIRWGLTAGLNASDYSFGDKRADIDNKLGWQFGLMSSIDIAFLSIEPQFLFLHQSLRYDPLDREGRANLRTNSIDVPILVAFDVIGPLRLFAGPVFTLMNKTSGGKNVFATGDGLSLSSMRSTCSYTAGIELRILKHYRADLRYNGQFKAKRHVMMPDGKENRMRSSFVALSIGYLF